MKQEAQIICSHPCEIPDLGLRLLRGEERWVSLDVAAGSADLRKEQSKGNVRVYRKPRRGLDKAPRLPQPPFVSLGRPVPRPRPEAPAPERVDVDADAIARKVKAELMGDLRPAIAEEVGRALATVQAQGGTVDQGQLETALEHVLRRLLPAGTPAPVGAPVAARKAPEEPLYMPQRIVDPDAKARIAVERRSSDGGGDVDDAAEALRAIRKRGG